LLSAGPDVFGNKETVVLIVIVLSKFKLLVVRWSKNLFLVCFFCELFGENFAFDNCTRFEISHLQADPLAHHFSIEVVTLRLFLLVFNRIGVGENLHLRAYLLFVQEAVIVGNVSIVDEHGS